MKESIYRWLARIGAVLISLYILFLYYIEGGIVQEGVNSLSIFIFTLIVIVLIVVPLWYFGYFQKH